MPHPKYEIYVNGKFKSPNSSKWIESTNPYTTKTWALIPDCDESDINDAVESAYTAFQSGPWSEFTATKRGEYLRKLATLIRENATHLAEIEVKDNGKLYAEMSAQLNYLPSWFEYYAGLADKIEGRVLPTDKADILNYTRYEPLGVVVAIVPWNSPLMIASWKLAPALAAGNTVILKPSEYTSASALEFAKIVDKVGFPPGVFNVVTGIGKVSGEALVKHPKVAKISFTGGNETGKHIYQTAAQSIKHVTLELGGKSPNIVFDDAIIDNAVKGVISGIFAASGQTCIAGSRCLVQESIYDEFVQKLVDFAKTAKLGNPMDENTQVGPITTPVQFEKVLSYFKIAKEDGATCVLGGERSTRPGTEQGWFIEPTIYRDVKNDMRIAQEEIFGPVLAVIPFKDDDEAVTIANDIQFGLASGLWTQNIKRAIEIPKRIQSGTVWVNTYRMFSYMSPFGGYKQSGIGRESGIDTIYQYLQQKSIWISTATEVQNPFIIK